MTEQEVAQTLQHLKNVAGIFEMYKVTTFKGYRMGKDQIEREVKVEILDAGLDVEPSMRYHAIARESHGDKIRSASGNPADSIRTVLATLHWYDLDRD